MSELNTQIFVCRRDGMRVQCQIPGCGKLGGHVCDYRLGGRAAGKTCGAALCSSHGVLVANNRHYCPTHAKLAETLDGRCCDALQARARAEIEKGAPAFMGKPDRWYDRGLFRCRNGHVSETYLKSEAVGADICLEAGCFARVWLTFPEDVGGVLGAEGERER